MREKIIHPDTSQEFSTREGCHILESANCADDEEVSIARARVEAGVSTRAHLLHGTTERYVILSGKGVVEVGGLPPEEVGSGDVVVIPPGVSQRITNTGSGDLVFLCVCSPRFRQENYQDLGE